MGLTNDTEQDYLNVIEKADSQLVALDLADSTFSGEGLVGLDINLPMLEKLDLGCNPFLTIEGVRELLTRCSATLKDLNLNGTDISGEGLENVPVLKLEKLNLAFSKVSNTGLQQLLAKCSATLKDINLSDTDISGESLVSVPVLKLNKLKMSNLTFTGISREGLENVPSLKLEKLNL